MTAADRPGELTVRIPPKPIFGRQVRARVRGFVAQAGAEPEETEEFLFAVGEALANAIEHSHSSGTIEVRCHTEEDTIMATVADSGAGFATDPLAGISLPDALAERGRGLPIMRRCTDIFAVHSVPGRGTSVLLGRYLKRRHQEKQLAS